MNVNAAALRPKIENEAPSATAYDPITSKHRCSGMSPEKVVNLLGIAPDAPSDTWL
jgi:hypothetical protein